MLIQRRGYFSVVNALHVLQRVKLGTFFHLLWVFCPFYERVVNPNKSILPSITIEISFAEEAAILTKFYHLYKSLSYLDKWLILLVFFQNRPFCIYILLGIFYHRNTNIFLRFIRICYSFLRNAKSGSFGLLTRESTKNKLRKGILNRLVVIVLQYFVCLKENIANLPFSILVKVCFCHLFYDKLIFFFPHQLKIFINSFFFLLPNLILSFYFVHFSCQ